MTLAALALLEGIITPEITLGSIITSGIVLPLGVWLIRSLPTTFKNHTLLNERVDKVCSDLTDLKKDFEKVRHTHTLHDARIQRVEDAIAAIRESAVKRDELFGTITTKLDQLPKLVAMAELFAEATRVIVPRNEVNARIEAAERRLELLERPR